MSGPRRLVQPTLLFVFPFSVVCFLSFFGCRLLPPLSLLFSAGLLSGPYWACAPSCLYRVALFSLASASPASSCFRPFRFRPLPLPPSPFLLPLPSRLDLDAPLSWLTGLLGLWETSPRAHHSGVYAFGAVFRSRARPAWRAFFLFCFVWFVLFCFRFVLGSFSFSLSFCFYLTKVSLPHEHAYICQHS